jgi:hypothetical protein
VNDKRSTKHKRKEIKKGQRKIKKEVHTRVGGKEGK